MVLRDVACGPDVETGASVPGYSGGAERFTERFLSRAAALLGRRGFGAMVLRDVA